MSDALDNGPAFFVPRDAAFEYRGLAYHELCRKPYQDMVISAGEILRGVRADHEANAVYLRIDRENDVSIHIDLTGDELAAIAYVANGTLWALLMGIDVNAHKAPLFVISETQTDQQE